MNDEQMFQWSLLGPVVAFFLALIISSIAAPFVMRLLYRMKSRQVVSQYVEEHRNKQGTPTMGGLMILAGAIPALLLVSGVSDPFSLALIFVIVGFALIGFLDDYLVPRVVPGKRGLDWLPKLGLQILIAGGAALIVQVSLWEGLLLVFLLLFFSNAFNFADGMDGLAASLWIALTFGIWLMSFWLDLPELVIVSVAVLGAVVPFLVLNSYPAKVFMGDVGSLPLGAVLGGCVWMMLVGTTNTTFAGTPFLIIAVVLFSGVMILELVPPPLQILAVKLFKRRIFPMTPIHHAFEKAGIPETRIVWGFFLLQLVLSMAAYGVLLLAF